jgi:hypothetical protein
MCFSLRPNSGAVCRGRRGGHAIWDDAFIVSFHPKISCVTVLLPSRVGIEENSS